MKKTKAARIREMLEAGDSVTFIKQMLGVSESYIYTIKKLLANNVEAVKKTILSVDNTVYPDITPEFAFSLSQGRQKRREEAEADTNVDAILDERAATYGSFMDVAKVAQQLKHVAASHTIAVGVELSHDKIEALEMIFSKIARIVNGNSDHIDSWIDIAGYATLVADRLQGKIR
jgi:hypothetical protein